MNASATKKLPGEGHKRGWLPLIQIDEATQNQVNSLFANAGDERYERA